MAAGHQQLGGSGDADRLVLASADEEWCARLEAAWRSEPEGGNTRFMRLTRSTAQDAPTMQQCLWLVDEQWLPQLLARHAPPGETAGGLRLIVRFDHLCSDGVVHAIEAGATGCLAGDADPGEALRAIRAVRAGELWLSRKLFARVLAHVQARAAPPHGDEPDLRLTERQRQIAACVAQGMSNKQIGRRLGISPTTVKTHLHNIFERVGVGGRTLLALRAFDGDAH